MNIRKSVIKGIRWTSFSTIYSAVIQVLIVYILTKYLTKTEFGQMAILLVVMNFSQILVDTGISKIILVFENLSPIQFSTLYWLNFIIGFLIYIILFLLSGFLGDFYNDSYLPYYIKIISISFLFIPIGYIYKFLAQKTLDFNIIAIFEIIARTIFFFSTILILIFYGGIWSLIIPNILFYLILTLLFFSYGFKKNPILFKFSFNSILKEMTFGSYTLFESIITFFYNQIDSIIIGKFLGLDVLGGYDVIKRLVLRPLYFINPIITKVNFPLLNKFKDDSLNYKRIYLFTIKSISLISAPIYVIIYIFSDTIVYYYLGAEWTDYSTILRYLTIYAFLRIIRNPIGPLLFAKHKANLSFNWNLIFFVLVSIVCFVLGQYNLLYLVIGLILLEVIIIYPFWKLLINKVSIIKFGEYISSFGLNLILSILSMSLIILPYKYYYHDVNIYMVILFFLVVYIVFLRLFNNEMFNLISKSLKG